MLQTRPSWLHSFPSWSISTTRSPYKTGRFLNGPSSPVSSDIKSVNNSVFTPCGGRKMGRKTGRKEEDGEKGGGKGGEKGGEKGGIGRRGERREERRNRRI